MLTVNDSYLIVEAHCKKTILLVTAYELVVKQSTQIKNQAKSVFMIHLWKRRRRSRSKYCICTVERFSSEKKMTSYLASVGTVDSSGSRTRNGGLSRRGRRTSYRYILQGLEHIVNGNRDFRKFKERHTLTRSNKVRAAIVRKTFVSMYFMLKNKEPYR